MSSWKAKRQAKPSLAVSASVEQGFVVVCAPDRRELDLKKEARSKEG